MSDIQKTNGYGSLGFMLMGILYLCQMMGSVISAAFTNKFGIKNTFYVSAILLSSVVFGQVVSAAKAAHTDHDREKNEGFWFNLIDSDLFVISVMVMCSCLSGFGSCILWVANGEFIALCANEHTRGFYFGLFWSIYNFS